MNTKQKLMLKPELILRYLIGDDDETDTLIMCKNSTINFITTDHDVYQALCCIKPSDNFNFNKLKKLFEVADIASFKEKFGRDKIIVTEKRVEELRDLALKDIKKNDN